MNDKIGDKVRVKGGDGLVGLVSEVRFARVPGARILYRVRVPMDPEPLWLEVRRLCCPVPDHLGGGGDRADCNLRPKQSARESTDAARSQRVCAVHPGSGYSIAGGPLYRRPPSEDFWCRISSALAP